MDSSFFICLIEEKLLVAEIWLFVLGCFSGLGLVVFAVESVIAVKVRNSLRKSIKGGFF
jgi:hypothetical protein